MASMRHLFVSASLCMLPVPTSGKGFLSDPGFANIDAQSLQSELVDAMGAALGCGGSVGTSELQAIESELMHIWRSLAKISGDRIDRRSLRYLVHRFFDRRSALHIRGFEPTRARSSSSWGQADVLSQRVPAFVESVLESKHKSLEGFDLRDAAYVVATIQQLVLDSESANMEKAYQSRGKTHSQSLNHQELMEVLETYLVNWFVGDDLDTVRLFLSNRTYLESGIPHWDKIVAMAEGQVKAMEYRRQQDPQRALSEKLARPGHNAMSARYSFEDAHHVVGSVTMTFASFWESECQSMKTSLVDMDAHHTGRVPLSKFYGSALDSEWRFGESETYLRELGALDETHWRGKQVIIPNYIQGASNCIVSTSHYLLCCVNECEALLGELEVTVGGPVASTSQLLALVRGMNSQASLDDDFPPELPASLVAQLEKIAAAHGGLVPLHGRLFAQWLHYAFPRECPFPHQTGSVVTMTPAEYGDLHLAERGEMQLHASANATELPTDLGREQLQWMSQWSPEEELVAEHVIRDLRAPWECKGRVATLALVVVAGVLAVVGAKGKAVSSCSSFSPSSQKAHFV